MPKPITKRTQTEFNQVFAPMFQMRRTDANKAQLTRYQTLLIKKSREAGVTPVQLESLTNISVFRIHQIVNASMDVAGEHNMVKIDDGETAVESWADAVDEAAPAPEPARAAPRATGGRGFRLPNYEWPERLPRIDTSERVRGERGGGRGCRGGERGGGRGGGRGQRDNARGSGRGMRERPDIAQRTRDCEESGVGVLTPGAATEAAGLKPIAPTPMPKPTTYVDLPADHPLLCIVAAARAQAVFFDQIQKKKQKQLRKMIPAGRDLEYYCGKYKEMNDKLNGEYVGHGRFPPEDFQLRVLMYSKLISDLVCPTKPKRNKEKYRAKREMRALAAQQSLEALNAERKRYADDAQRAAEALATLTAEREKIDAAKRDLEARENALEGAGDN